LTIKGTGQLQGNRYGVGNFTSGTATYIIATDGSGNFFEYPSGGISGGNLVTADNGLTASTSTNVQLFGPVGTPATLLNDRYLTAADKTLNLTFNSLAGVSGFKLSTTSTAAASNSQKLVEIDVSGANATASQTTYGIYLSNAHTGTTAVNKGIYSSATGTSAIALEGNTSGSSAISVQGFNSGSGIGVYGASATGYGISASSTSVPFAAISTPASTNTVVPVAYIQRASSGTPANGIGASIDYQIRDASNTSNTSNTLASKWVDATNVTRTSLWTLTGVTSATTQDWLSVGQSGYVKFRPMTVTEAGALTAADGMLIYVSNTDGTFTSIGFWARENGAWVKH
jgi:hypothetical protein